MNSIVSTDGRLAEIENNIHTLKKDVAHGLIEIGKNLIEAKTLVKHGEWSGWLENNVGFSQRSAQNYMRLARTFSGLNVSGLDASKLFLLQEMPEDERADFLKEKDVSSMSVREMKAAIREKSQPTTEEISLRKLDTVGAQKKSDEILPGHTVRQILTPEMMGYKRPSDDVYNRPPLVTYGMMPADNMECREKAEMVQAKHSLQEEMEGHEERVFDIFRKMTSASRTEENIAALRQIVEDTNNRIMTWLDQMIEDFYIANPET